METIGFVGVGKIGLPISENLIKSGYRVLGYRRSSLADFEKLGGVPARSPPRSARRRRSCSRACLPREALDDVVQGPNGLAQVGAARSNHRRARLPSGARQGAARGSARRQGRGLSRRRGERDARHGGGAQGRDLPRRRPRGLQEGRARGRGLCRFVPLFRQVRRRQPGQARQQSAGRYQYRRHRRGHGARPQGRRRRRSDDQGDRHAAAAARPSSASARPGWRSAGSCRRRARCRRCSTTST